ncbi:carboxymuconolactone decarboxylase family protein [Salinithrix halophila]|uniref:Carboxymuconolactone decarboxylase family protein n=1 Tax=Salinithrix halophila TaxID=1485204 RepID=A0ABV8JBW5_9BACL
MEGSMIQQALQDYKEGVGVFQKHLPKVAQEYIQFTEACFEEGELSGMHKHLIGLALGLMANDEYCIIFHAKGAIDQGASDRQVLEAAAVAGAFGSGLPMSQSVTLLQDALIGFQGGVEAENPGYGQELQH